MIYIIYYTIYSYIVYINKYIIYILLLYIYIIYLKLHSHSKNSSCNDVSHQFYNSKLFFVYFILEFTFKK